MAGLLTLVELGRVAYPRALSLQQRLVELRRTSAIGDVLLLLEHDPVLTLGRNAGRQHILATDFELAARGIALHIVNRGGDVTYHGPGQLVGYPILDLREHSLDTGARLGVVDFVRRLEETLIRAAGEYGVPAQRVAGRSGVWTQPVSMVGGGSVAEKKLAAIGVHVSRGITSHGFALNVSTDLRDFALIVPCGIADRTITSLEDEVAETDETAQPLTVAAVGQTVARSFGRVFGQQVLAISDVTQLHASLGDW